MNGNIKQKVNIIKVLFVIYILFLIWIILFKSSISVEDFVGLSTMRCINLIPFHYQKETIFHLREVIANILIFIPLGIYLKLLGSDSKRIILYGILLSILLEICQFIFKLGATDITDVITNSSGILVGITWYYLLEKIFKNKEKINKFLRLISLFFTILFSLIVILLIVSN